MTPRPSRFAVLASTGGAVLGQLLESSWFRDRVAVVAVDRPCGALERALAAGVATALCADPDAVVRERELVEVFDEHQVQHVLVFYTRMLRHDLLHCYRGRLWNLHPSLLPAFPGRHGFDEAFHSGACLLGTTLHAIDAGMDTGPILSQTAFARPPGMDAVTARHAVFGQQVRSALQACHWLADGRVSVQGERLALAEPPATSLHDGALYAPGLEAREAIEWMCTPADPAREVR